MWHMDDVVASTLSERHRRSAAYALEAISRSPFSSYADKVILFGSCGRCEAEYGSDVDLLLVLPESARQMDLHSDAIHLKAAVIPPDVDLPEVDLYCHSASPVEDAEKSKLLRTHSLGKLLNSIERMGIHAFSDDERGKILLADGYCFTARYPGDDSFFVSQRDIDSCMTAVDMCRDVTLAIMKERG